ncbi:STAS domain-containing protein [Aestuariivirga sp.]|uniref:STAS domain-containing protein n=1 Tax=Aestuariivirga sp. TaxID=2650926 RepID=UPI0037847BFC
MANLSHDKLGNALILKPSRRIDSSNAKAFEDEAAALVDSGPKLVVIDASDLDYISSAGLRGILTTAKRAKAAGGGLTIACARTNVKEVLAVSGFDNIFGLHASVEAAVAALAK